MRPTKADQIAGELYLVPPAGFVAARDELVRQAHAAGARELAQQLRALRRPTLSAWLVNLLARHERASMDHLVAVGRELRDAQAQLDAARLRRLARQRQRLIADLIDRGRRRASEAGIEPSSAVLSEVEATLKAALVDLAASSTVLSGRLVRPLSHSGFGPSPDMPLAPRPPARPSAREVHFPADELARRRAEADKGGDRKPPQRALSPVPDRPLVWPGPADEERDVWSALSPNGQHPWPTAGDDEQDLWSALSPSPNGQHPAPLAADDEQHVLRAAAELAAVESEHWQREFELADAEGAVDAARDRCEQLDSQRFQARRDKVTAERHLAQAQAAQQSAVRAVEDARRALEAAERRLRSTHLPPSPDTDS